MADEATTPPEDEADDEASDRKNDPEWLIVGQMLRLMRKVNPKTRPHVVAYLASRFQDE